MRTLAFSLSIGIGALGVTSGVLAQHEGEAVSPSAARAAYSRFAGIYKLITTEGRGYLAYDPAGYVSVTIQGREGSSPASSGGSQGIRPIPASSASGIGAALPTTAWACLRRSRSPRRAEYADIPTGPWIADWTCRRSKCW